MFKKIFTVFFAFLFCAVTFFSSGANAVTSTVPSAEDITELTMNYSEDTGIYTFSVSIKSDIASDIEGIALQLHFNSDVFEHFNSYTAYSPDAAVNYLEQKKCLSFFYLRSSNCLIESDTVLFVASFRKKAGNFNDSYQFLLVVEDLYKKGLIDIKHKVNNRLITVGNVQPEGELSGDVNQDGKVDSKDLVILGRYLANWEGYDKKINLFYSDVNGDGSIDPLDLIHLSRYIAGWSGYKLAPVDELIF